jgi:hypothetical protein
MTTARRAESPGKALRLRTLGKVASIEYRRGRRTYRHVFDRAPSLRVAGKGRGALLVIGPTVADTWIRG